MLVEHGLCGGSGELSGGGVESGEDCGGGGTSSFGELVTVGVGDFVDEAVGTEESKFAAYPRRAPARFVWSRGCLREVKALLGRKPAGFRLHKKTRRSDPQAFAKTDTSHSLVAATPRYGRGRRAAPGEGCVQQPFARDSIGPVAGIAAARARLWHMPNPQFSAACPNPGGKFLLSILGGG